MPGKWASKRAFLANAACGIASFMKSSVRWPRRQLAGSGSHGEVSYRLFFVSQSKNHRPVEALGNTMRMLGADEFDGSATKGWANTDMLVATAAPLPLVTPLEPLTTVPSPQKTLNQNDGRDL